MLSGFHFFPLPAPILQSSDYETFGFILMKSEIIQNHMTLGAAWSRKKHAQHHKKSPTLVTLAFADAEEVLGKN